MARLGFHFDVAAKLVDRTALSVGFDADGQFDPQLLPGMMQLRPEELPPSDAGSLATTLQEQLGLNDRPQDVIHVEPRARRRRTRQMTARTCFVFRMTANLHSKNGVMPMHVAERRDFAIGR